MDNETQTTHFYWIATAYVMLHGLRVTLAIHCRGRRWLDTKRFELTRLAKFIRRALEERYGCVRKIVAPAAPRL